jgi:hypothetical protein
MLAAILLAADQQRRSAALRELFSACCEVYARLNMLAAAFDGPVLDTGTANVDFNPPNVADDVRPPVGSPVAYPNEVLVTSRGRTT